MDTALGYLIMGVLAACSAVIFSRVANSVWALPQGLVSTDRYRWGDAVFVGGLVSMLVALYGYSAWAAKGQTSVMNFDTVIVGCVFDFLLILMVLGFLVVRRINPLRVFGLIGRVKARHFLIGIGLLLCAYPMILFAQMLSYAVTSPEARPQEIVTFLLNSHHWYEQLAVAVLAVILAPIAEELIFRGYLYGVIRKYGGRVWAIGLSSLVFAVIHVHLPAMTALFVLAVVLCLAYELTGSLWVNIAMHSCFNGVSVYVAIFHPSLAQ